MVPWPKIDAWRKFIFNEISIIGKTPRGRKLQPPDLCGLKIIESWIFHFSKQKRSTTGQQIWTLFSWYLFPKNYFWLNSVINNWGKSCLDSFIWSEPHDSVLAETYMNAINCFFLNVDICLTDYSSTLYIQNKKSSRSRFGLIFLLIFIWSPSRHREGKQKNQSEIRSSLC